MPWIVARMKAIMIVSGLLTCTMVYAAIDPQAGLRTTFGESLDGPLADIVVRNWGALIALVGAMLIYGAFHLPSRPLALAVAAASKLTFITLVASRGGPYVEHALVALVVDGVMVIVFVLYLAATRGGPAPR